MKKLFTLLTLMVCAIGTAWAGDVFEIKFQNSKSVVESPKGFFTYNKGEGSAVSWSSKGKHSCTYNGETYSDVIKMEKGTQAYFNSTAEATVTIVQTTSNATGDKLTFDDENLNADLANTSVTVDADNKCNVYVITNVAAGKHTITRQSETGLAYIKVEYTGATMTQLAAPVITIDAASGEVTIGAVENATKVTYTVDGTDPTADSNEYTASFTAEDGVTVKAIAIGDDESYINSTIASKLVILENATIATPVINQYNGTVAITCETAGATIEYSLDGETYTTYTRAFTLAEDGTVYARAKRGDNMSDVESAEVTTISKGNANKTIWMGIGSFTDNTKNSMTGTAGDDAEGIVLAITGNTEKYWSSGTDKISIGGNERTTIKLSNGAENTMTLPDGMQATRITFYSFINSAAARTTYWKEFNGETISADVPMGAWNNVSDRLTNPDVRVFPLNGESSFTFTNTGEQLCFIIALDVVEAEDPELSVNAEELTFKTAPYSKKSTATVKLSGKYLSDGDYTVDLPTIDGLSIEPAQFTVTDGNVSQEFTLTYAPETGEDTSGDLTFSVDGVSATVQLVFEYRAETYELAEVSETTTWDWSKLTEIVQLDNNTTPARNTEFVLAELENEINFVEAFGDAKSVAVKNIQFPSRGGYAQNGTIIIKTTVPGTITLEYSNTGSDNNQRWPQVNGQTFGDEAVGTEKKTATSPVVPAGEVAISGTAALRYFKLTFTPADAPTITAEITEAGYATFSSLFEVEIPSGVEAYYASESDGETVTMTSIDGGVIPAGTGVVLKGEADSYTLTVSETGATLGATNLLKANIADREPSEAEYYTLAEGPKFSKSTGGTLAGGKAYLVLPSSGSRTVTMKFDGGATGISELKTANADGAIYNLNGVRVSQPAKGLYIQNGKKFVK